MSPSAVYLADEFALLLVRTGFGHVRRHELHRVATLDALEDLHRGVEMTELVVGEAFPYGPDPWRPERRARRRAPRGSDALESAGA